MLSFASNPPIWHDACTVCDVQIVLECNTVGADKITPLGLDNVNFLHGEAKRQLCVASKCE